MGRSCAPRRPAPGRPSRYLKAGLACLLWLVSLPALAGSLQVSPILLEFRAEEQAQGLWLSNSGNEPIRAQVRVQTWAQSDEGDLLSATDDLAASPPILQIGAGERQLVRIVRLKPTVATAEHAYRLLVDELPASDEDTNPGLQFLLRYSVPVFLLPTGATPLLEQTGTRPPTDLTRASAQFQRAEDGKFRLSLRNDGDRRLRVSQLVHVANDGTRTTLVPGLLGYALAGQHMQWTLTLPAEAGNPGVLKARFNDDLEDQTLPLGAAGR